MTRPKHDGTVALDTSFLETRLAALGLKQYWLAEQLGVSPRTVLRWVNGQVRRIGGDHLGPLARLLACREDELSPSEGVGDARDDAARMIADEDILTLLTPTSSYPMAEALIKASLTPGLAPHTLGKLHVMLSLAVGRQFRIPEAVEHARRAERLGTELGNRVIVVRAWYAEGWARLYAGEIAAARALFQRAVAEHAYLGEPYDEAMAWFGLGSCQGYEHELAAALASLDEAVTRLAPLDRPLDLSMPLYVRGVMLLGAGRTDDARASLTASLDAATRVGWGSGMGRATAALAECAARHGDPAAGVVLLDRALAILAGEKFIHPQVFVSGARVCLLAGDRARAALEVARGLGFAERYVAEREALEALRAEIGSMVESA